MVDRLWLNTLLISKVRNDFFIEHYRYGRKKAIAISLIIACVCLTAAVTIPYEESRKGTLHLYFTQKILFIRILTTPCRGSKRG